MAQQNEIPFQFILEGFEHAVLLLDADGAVCALNNAVTDLISRSRENILGLPIWNLGWVAADSSEKNWKEALLRALQGERIHFKDEFAGSSTRVNFSVAAIDGNNSDARYCLVEIRILTDHTPLGLSPPASISPQPKIPGDFAPVSKQKSAKPFIESEVSFRLMVESIEDYAMFMVNLKGEITSWNRGAERLTGYSEDEALGRHFSMLYPRETLDVQHAMHELTMAMQHGRYEEQGVRVRKNGSRYHAQIIVWRIDDNDGNTIGFAKVTRDVSTLIAAQLRESQLFESENRFRLMVESIEDYAIFMVDLSGLIISWNRGAERLTGYSEKEALGQPFSILYPKEGTPKDHAAYELTMAQQHGRYEEEGLRVRKNGSVYHALIMVWPVEDKAGNIIGFAKITRDVTERRRAEQALRNSEAKFRSITDAMPQMVWSALPDGKWDFASQQWLHFTGRSATETSGDDWLSLVHPDDQTAAKDAWLACVATGKSYETQFRLKHSSNTFRWTLARALPVRNERGDITRWMGTVTDIHEQKRAEALLQESARRKDDFLAMLAHELRNPLGPIRNSTVLIRRLGELDDKSIHAIDIIERQVRHMTRLIDDLLDVARISRGKIELRREIIDLGEVVRHTVDDFRPDFDRKDIRLQVEIPAQPLSLLADRTRIAQAIGNLLHNSLKFTPAQGEVCVRLSKVNSHGKSYAEVKVRDTGTGIDPELLEQLFLPFMQANQDLARSQGGLGLGLALIKGFIDLHGGKVQAHSEGPGRGAEFGFQLPLVTVPFAEANAQISSNMAYSPLNILVIDDNRDMVETMVALLSIDGHRVRSAYDGESGLALILEEKPDLVICDIGLPGAYDGYAVARTVRANPALNNLFMVALSGYGQEQDKRLSLESGFNAHLLKPVDFKSLAEMIATAGRLRGC